jgi:mortality factor 4-like protein 1
MPLDTMATMPESAAASGFRVGDQCFALHDGSTALYKARVLLVRGDDGAEPQFLIHYDGWNKKWDEWVPARRLLPFTKENEKLKQDRDSAAKAAEKAVKAEAKIKKESAGSSRHSKKPRKKVLAKRDLETRLDAPDVNIPLSFTHKKMLVVDWENVQKQRLVPLPRDPTVSSVLEKFHEHKIRQGTPGKDTVKDCCHALAALFDDALPRMLLYRFERLQYHDYFDENEKSKDPERPDLRPSEVYGAEHLLRLFVRIPDLLATTSMPPHELHTTSRQLHDILKFMQRQASSIFLTEYEDTSDEYIAAYEKALKE